MYMHYIQHCKKWLCLQLAVCVGGLSGAVLADSAAPGVAKGRERTLKTSSQALPQHWPGSPWLATSVALVGTA